MIYSSSMQLNFTTSVNMEMSEWNYEEEGKEVNDFLKFYQETTELDALIDSVLEHEERRNQDKNLEQFFKETTPEDLDFIVNNLFLKKKTNKRVRKDKELLLTEIADKYDLPLDYVVEEWL